MSLPDRDSHLKNYILFLKYIRVSAMEQPSDRSSGSPEDANDTTSTPSSETRADLSLDDVFELLSNRRRRAVLRHLRTTADEETTLDELATRIAAEENGIDIPQVTSKQRKRVYVSLYQGHLSKLDDCGIIEYQKSRGTVALRDLGPLEPHLRLSTEADTTDSVTDDTDRDSEVSMPDRADRTWISVYAALGLLAALTVGSLGIKQSLVPPLAYLGMSLGAFALLALGCIGHVHAPLVGDI